MAFFRTAKKDTDGMVVPDCTKNYSKRSLRRAQLKRKTAAATAKKGARQKPLPARKQRKPVKIEKAEEHFAAASELLKNVIQSPEISEQFGAVRPRDIPGQVHHLHP